MLFNSYVFLFAFLPLTLAGFAVIARGGDHRLVLLWLAGCSLVFYGWWYPGYLALILASIAVNYAVGLRLGDSAERRRRWVLAAGIAFNVGLLGYFKYTNFIAENVGALLGTRAERFDIVLPLAISFFTFQQISYLVDSYRSGAPQRSALRYLVYVAFFPQLIAGPIVRHGVLGPQLAEPGRLAVRRRGLAIGLTIFAIGLFKKVLLADTLATVADPVFAAADAGTPADLLAAWAAVLAFAFQIYFDFSGYSDMAVGLAKMFNVNLPINFYSPYKATSIIDFWRHWHITLSSFLRDYLYIPLGGNRRGRWRSHLNVLVTMLIGGLWHGASWNFVIWGGLHGLYLVVNRGWRALGPRMPGGLAWGLTFVAVVASWAFFRAETYAGATSLLTSMAGLNGIAVPDGIVRRIDGLGAVLAAAGVGMPIVPVLDWLKAIALVALGLAVVTGLPNTAEIVPTYGGVLAAPPARPLAWRPSPGWATAIGAMLALAVAGVSAPTEFIYFQF